MARAARGAARNASRTPLTPLTPLKHHGKRGGATRGGAKGGGGKGGKGGKGGSPQGQWLFVPASAPVKRGQPSAMQGRKGQKGGKGARGKDLVLNWMASQKIAGRAGGRARSGQRVVVGGRASGKAGGKGGGKAKVANKELDKLQELDASLKVWIGGLDEKTSWKKVQEHFKDIGKTKVALMKGGKACIAFSTPEEVSDAISTLNSSELGGKTLEVDVWTQKERTPKEEGEKQKRQKVKKIVKTGFAAKVAKGKKDGKSAVTNRFWEKLKVMDISLKVRVTNVADGVTGKMLKDHFKERGAECTLVDLMVKEKGTACVGFKTADEAESSIAAAGGSDLNGQSIEVTPWTKPERINRKDKKKSDE